MISFPCWLSYDLPEALIGQALKGKYRGQKQKWFAMQFDGTDADVRLDAHELIEFTDWQWRPLADCVELVVPFKRHIYQYVANQFAHLAALCAHLQLDILWLYVHAHAHVHTCIHVQGQASTPCAHMLLCKQESE